MEARRVSMRADTNVSGELMQALAVAKQRAEGLAPSVALHGSEDGEGDTQPAVAELSDQAFVAPSASKAGGTLQELVAWADAELRFEQRSDEHSSGAELKGSSVPQDSVGKGCGVFPVCALGDNAHADGKDH